MLPLRILVTGDPVEGVVTRYGTFPELLRRAAQEMWTGEWDVVDCRTVNLDRLDFDCSGLIVTGSPDSVLDRHPWMLKTEEHLRNAAARGLPILGVCFGHQLLAQALGGRVERNPFGREMGTVPVVLVASDPILDDTLSPFWVNATHVDAVTELPDGACALARTEKDPHCVIRFRDYVYGVQFHPELDRAAMVQYIEARAPLLEQEGFDVRAMIDGASAAEAGRSVLRRFVAMVRAIEGSGSRST